MNPACEVGQKDIIVRHNTIRQAIAIGNWLLGATKIQNFSIDNDITINKQDDYY